MVGIEEQIHRHVCLSPERPALVDASTGVTITYGELWHSIESAAAWFRGHDIGQGKCVLLAASKEPLFVAVYFGAHMAGVTTVAIDPESNPERLERILSVAHPECVIGTLRHGGALKALRFEEIKSDPLPNLRFPQPDAPVDILFTTGTTGVPKGVVLSARNEMAAARGINEFIGNTADDVELLALPISHSFGLGRIRCVLSKGGCLVLLGSFASMKRFYGAIEDYGVNGFGMVPASWAYVTKMSGDRIGCYAGQLRYIEIGSAPMAPEEKHRLMSLLPDTRICMHYGLTEASRSTFISFHDEVARLDTAGRATPGTEVAIFSPDGVRLGADTEGEVCVAGEHVCAGYIPKDDYHKDFFGRWFRTGDWGALSADGYLLLKGRSKEMINVGGKKVNPTEVENLILAMGGVKDCACIGQPDPVLGEVVAACIVADESVALEDVTASLSGQLENYKMPRMVVMVPEIPRTSSGKIQRQKLKS